MKNKYFNKIELKNTLTSAQNVLDKKINEYTQLSSLMSKENEFYINKIKKLSMVRKIFVKYEKLFICYLQINSRIVKIMKRPLKVYSKI